jgi:ankyrin repeat protein
MPNPAALDLLLASDRCMTSVTEEDMNCLFTLYISTLDGDHLVKLCGIIRTQQWSLTQAATEAAANTIIERQKGISAIKAIREVGKLMKDYRNDLGWSWLHIAAQSDEIEMLRYFLDWGIDPNLINAAGCTALDIATCENCEEAMTFLRIRGGLTGREIYVDSAFSFVSSEIQSEHFRAIRQ